jgi:hypothetical protein
MTRGPRSTPPGEHRPVLLDEVLAALDPRPGEVAVDCTVGFAGHAAELLRRVGPVSGLARMLDRLGIEGSESPGLAAAGVEFVLEGLYLTRRLSKEELPGRIVYGRQ